MKIRIYYEDTDAGGIVYHTNYIKYCERARSELFFKQNIAPMDEEKSGFVVSSINANFLGMAFLGDMVEVSSEVLEKKYSSVIIKQSVSKDAKVIFTMDVVLVFIRNGKPARIPEHMRDILS